MATAHQQLRVVDAAFGLMKKLAAEPPVSDKHIDWLRDELQKACDAALIPYGQAVRAAVLAMEASNRPFMDKLFRLARSGAPGRDVLTIYNHNGKPTIRINPVR